MRFKSLKDKQVFMISQEIESGFSIVERHLDRAEKCLERVTQLKAKQLKLQT